MANKVLTDEEKTNLYKNTSSTKAGKNDINKLGGLTNPNLRSSNNLSNNDNNTSVNGVAPVGSAVQSQQNTANSAQNSTQNATNIAPNGSQNTTNAAQNGQNVQTNNGNNTEKSVEKAVGNNVNTPKKDDLLEKKPNKNAEVLDSTKDIQLSHNIPQTAGDIINADKTAMNDKLRALS